MNNDWIYIPACKMWWRNLTNPVPPNGDVFNTKPPHCERCNVVCNQAYEIGKKLFCKDCFQTPYHLPPHCVSVFKYLNLDTVGFLKQRETTGKVKKARTNAFKFI